MNTLLVGDPALADIERVMRGRVVELEQKYPVPNMMIPPYGFCPPIVQRDPMWVPWLTYKEESK